ncbi:MAG: IPT/TIG domain-containing protein [Opitutaceae bacterium]|nr:IPT/TIG domain-containing protein [Opitutaceae bacterium]
MDACKSRFASLFTRVLAASAAVLLLAGCDVKIINRTPATFTENPSGVYTITAEVQVKSGVVKKETLKPSIVIDGQIYPMTQSDLAPNMWEYDYRLPAGRSEGKYYFVATFDTSANGKDNQRDSYTDVHTFTIANRYTLSLDVNRAPVGSTVTVLGRGFTPTDVIYLGDSAAQTQYKSANTLTFTVPAVPGGRNYPVSVGGPGSNLQVGTIRVDEGAISVFPNSLALATKGRRQLVFTIPAPAPDGGLLLDITTDVPASVVMPEVVVPAGQQSVNVVVEGGKPGSGTIFIKAPGFGEATVAVTVSGR